MAKNKLKTTAQIAVDFVKKLRLLSRKLRCYCCYWDEVLYMSRAVCWYIYRTFITTSQQIMCVILWFYLSGLAFDCADWWSCLFGWWLLFASVSRLKLWGSPNVGCEGSVCSLFPRLVHTVTSAIALDVLTRASKMLNDTFWPERMRGQ